MSIPLATMTRTERNLCRILEKEFRRRLGKLMPNDPLWLDKNVESLRRLITGQTVYQARDTVVEYVETVKCHLMGESFTGWVGHTDPEIAEPMARPTLLCRNIKKYEEKLEQEWNPDDGTKKREPRTGSGGFGFLGLSDAHVREYEPMLIPAMLQLGLMSDAVEASGSDPGKLRIGVRDNVTGSSTLNGSSDVFTRTRGAI